MCNRIFFSEIRLISTPIFLTFFSLVVFAISLSYTPVIAAEGESVQEITKNLEGQDVDSIVATMGDVQVRRLLIDELKKQAEQERLASGGRAEMTGIAGSIQKTRDLIMQFRASIDRLRSQQDIDLQKERPNIYQFLADSKRGTNPTQTILSVVLVFVFGLLINWVFDRYVFAAKKQIEAATLPKWSQRLTGLTFRALMDLVSIIIFVAAVIICSFLFLELNAGQRVLIASYLAAFAIVLSSNLILKFLLAPQVPGLRLLPLSDEVARYLYRWFLAVAIVISFGLFTCGIFRLAGFSEADHYVMVTMVAAVVAIMFIVMILQNKHKVVGVLTEGKPATSLQYRLARYWHHLAIFLVVLIVLFSMVQRLFLGMGSLAAVKTLLIIGLYILFDWLLRLVLKVAFGIAEQSDILDTVIETAKKGELAATVGVIQEKVDATLGDQSPTERPASQTGQEQPEASEEPPEAVELPPKVIYESRMQTVVRAGLRIALFVYMLFLGLRVWGFHFTLGESIANALFSILVTVLLCYIVWELINTKIKQKLKEEMSDDEEEMEEGGAGGSRVGTLLLLLQKFFMIVIVTMVVLVVLSSLGINIGPLIAGAGIVGLAIGFGAQTLVQDIIAGLFFLIDDAFRVGDYLEVGGIKGTVEEISIRSFKLRHPRGMLNTIPFGSIDTVTNWSRDYIITKLDFRVRYGTDVEKVRKIIKKKVYKIIAADEELGPKLLAPIKSQGVRQLDDSAMIMRVKFKTVPGDQFGIRKEVFRLLQEAFREEGVEFAHKNVTVYMPDETSEGGTTSSPQTSEKLKQAAAAAALAAEESQTETPEKPKG